METCKESLYGCCPDEVTPKRSESGENCPPYTPVCEASDIINKTDITTDIPICIYNLS